LRSSGKVRFEHPGSAATTQVRGSKTFLGRTESNLVIPNSWLSGCNRVSEFRSTREDVFHQSVRKVSVTRAKQSDKSDAYSLGYRAPAGVVSCTAKLMAETSSAGSFIFRAARFS
jgi:hypothetical protein